MSWPPRWAPGPHFKGSSTSPRVEKRQEKAETKAAEEKNKRKVRTRDKGCRFPLCGCRKLKIQPHVSHSQHKGMGGNPAGDRSAPELLIHLCACRHRENRISIDKGTLRWRELEKGKGSEGPIAWDIRTSEIPAKFRGVWRKLEWFEVWRETERGRGVPTTARAFDILKWLGTMEA